MQVQIAAKISRIMTVASTHKTITIQPVFSQSHQLESSTSVTLVIVYSDCRETYERDSTIFDVKSTSTQYLKRIAGSNPYTHVRTEIHELSIGHAEVRQLNTHPKHFHSTITTKQYKPLTTGVWTLGHSLLWTERWVSTSVLMSLFKTAPALRYFPVILWRSKMMLIN